MTNSKKDSELESILNYYGMRCSYEAMGSVPSDAELLTRDQAIQAIKSNYITKEESDRRVLEARIDELDCFTKKYGSYNDGCGCCMTETIRKWNDHTSRYDGEMRSQWLINRIAELRELLKGGKQ